jgi:curli biogenesis system outer membrane secretion channel CsgG
MKKDKQLLGKGGLIVAALALAGCAGMPTSIPSTTPQLGGGSTMATGSAGGANTANASTQLEKCERPLGTLGVVEDRAMPWYQQLSQYKLGSTVPVLRLMVQQSNCFVIVERGAAMDKMMGERELEKSGEMRTNSNFGKGQMVAADFTLNPSITFSQKGTQGMSGSLGGFGILGSVAGMVAGNLKANEASTMLIMIDNRSGVQLAAAEGSAKNYDFGVFGSMFGGGAWGSAGGYTNTPEGKIIVASFMDSYNNVVRAVRNYKAQEVAGGLGTGGQLGVQGGATPASQPNQAAAAPAKAAKGKTKKQ